VNDVPDGSCLFINGRVIADSTLTKRMPLSSRSDVVYVRGEQIIGARLSGTNLARIRSRLSSLLTRGDFDGIPVQETDIDTAAYPWELVHRNGKQIVADYESLMRQLRSKKVRRGKTDKGVHLLGKSQIFIEEGARVKPGVVLDAEDGPIYIGKKVKVFPQATLMGPLCVWDGSSIKVGAQIYENTTIGPVCKVGGEVEETIIQGYSNKQHAGFLGHAYLGSWVNLGADTNNSDLKNNYGTVKVQVGDREVDTKLQFVGLTMGDHSKSSINSMFNTGTVVGVSCNVFGEGFPPKSVPSFTWGGAGGKMETYAVDKAIGVAKRVMARRSIELTADDERLFRGIFEATRGERQRSGMSA
jgi:UDP-N-acetylglucosamine diphosphorylase/glucosamine-1-phosphate N-acetyltransferase